MTTPMHACTDLLSGHEWRDNDHEFYYPAVSAAVSSAGTTSIGRLWDSSVFVNKAQVKLKKEKAAIEKKNRKAAKYPLRIAIPAPIQGEMLQTILTNHFEIGIDAQHLYQYEILDLKGEGRTKKKIQALFNRALVAWPYLDNKKANFATDNQRTIISWVNLHENLPFPPIISGDGPNNAGAQWPKQDITTGNNPIGANLKFVGMVEISKILNRSKAELSEVRTDVTAIERCINIIISKSFDHEIFRHSPDKFFVKKSRSTFYHKVNNVKHHSTSLEIMRGYYYAVKPGMGCLLMNFNVATSAFFRPILVSQFLEDDDTFSSPVQRMAILSKLRVYVDPKHKEERLNKFGARIKTIHSVGDNNNPDHNIEDSTFHKKRKGADGRPIVDAQGNYVYEQNPTHVTDHIKDCFGFVVVKGRKGDNVGTDADPVWYAQEHLRIAPYQIYTRTVPDHLTASMVEQAALGPQVAQHLIEQEGLAHIGFSEAKYEKVGFRNGIPLSLYPTRMQVQSAVMPFPGVQYQWNQHHKGKATKKGEQPQPTPDALVTCSWNMRDDIRFHESPFQTLRYYIIQMLHPEDVTDAIANIEFELKNQMDQRCHVANNQVIRVNLGQAATSVGPQQSLSDRLKDAANLKANLVVLMLPSFDRHIYPAFKELADKQFGLRSLCLAKPSQLKKLDDSTSKYISNIALKINIKFGGINALVSQVSQMLGKDTLVLGADVVHPGAGAFEHSPSIACIVGSVDNQAGRFLGSARLQSKDKTDREIIDHVKEMVIERIRSWMVETGSKNVPNNIIYYRDGVSEGQYARVVDVELAAITSAVNAVKSASNLMTMAKQLMVTAIVGVKWHHTRFYPTTVDQMDKWGNNNCKPGTYVEQLVTSPYYRDFYLQSHSGIKGIARPTHYFILRDDAIPTCKGTAELRKLTHHLCYTYCRATTGISYAAPTYYADRLCDRARMYLPKTWSTNDPVFEDTLATDKDNELQRLQTDRDTKYRNGQAFDAAAGDEKRGQEIEDEKLDPECLRAFTRDRVLAYAKGEFYAAKPQGTVTENP